jgi:DNA-binding response OmpR family regulator
VDAILLLLVEDDHGVQQMLHTELTDAGFQVIVVSNGTQAITQLEEKAAQLRAIITDIRLGTGPDGWEVARRARELIPDMPVVYVTGDSADEWSSKGVPKSVVIVKPFSPAQLTTAVSTLLNEADTNRVS